MTENYCDICGREIPQLAPGGMCPVCLLKGGISGPQEIQQDQTVAWPQNAPKAEELAVHFPQLEILSLLGLGGMGAVYHARQVKLERAVALKIILPQSAQDPSFAERFSREARTLARLNHPNIVGIHDFGEFEKGYFFLMEYVAGANLRQILQEGSLDQALALSIVQQICDALQYAHDEGVVHRDIKPENILVDKSGRVKIADFGLARLSHGATGPDPRYMTLTGTNQVMGTPRYMAPEQIEAARRVDQRADIYSLGVVFYEMLTGEVPMGSFEPPSQKGSVDKRIDDVVLKAMAREPDRRYQQISGLASDVSQISGMPYTSGRDAAAGARANAAASIQQAYESTESWDGLSAILDRDARAMGPWVANALNSSSKASGRRAPVSMILLGCVAGGVSTAFNWLETTFTKSVESGLETRVVQSIGAMDPFGMGVPFCFGVAAAALLATPVKRQMPIWLSVFLLSCGLVALYSFILYAAETQHYVGAEFQATEQSLLPAYWVGLVCAVGLMVSGLIGVRYGIAVRSEQKAAGLLNSGESIGDGTQVSGGGFDLVTITKQEIEEERLPGICMVCGDHASTIVNHTYEWQPGFLEELQRSKNPLVAITKKKFRLPYPVCRKHVNHRTRYILLCSLGWVAPIACAMIGMGIASASDMSDDGETTLMAIGFLVTLAGWIGLMIRSSFRQFRVARIDDDEITLERVSWRFAKAMKNSSMG